MIQNRVNCVYKIHLWEIFHCVYFGIQTLGPLREVNQSPPPPPPPPSPPPTTTTTTTTTTITFPTITLSYQGVLFAEDSLLCRGRWWVGGFYHLRRLWNGSVGCIEKPPRKQTQTTEETGEEMRCISSLGFPRHPNASWEGVLGTFLGSKYLLRRCLDV